MPNPAQPAKPAHVREIRAPSESSAALLSKDLVHWNSDIRISSGMELLKRGLDDAFPAFSHALRHSKNEVRLDALQVLRSVQDPKIISFVARHFNPRAGKYEYFMQLGPLFDCHHELTKQPRAEWHPDVSRLNVVLTSLGLVRDVKAAPVDVVAKALALAFSAKSNERAKSISALRLAVKQLRANTGSVKP